MINHETIHYEQILDFTPNCFPEWVRLVLGGLCFYVLYLLEWLFKLIPCAIKKHNAYNYISFEQEAYENEKTDNYLVDRKRFNWIKSVFKI